MTEHLSFLNQEFHVWLPALSLMFFALCVFFLAHPLIEGLIKRFLPAISSETRQQIFSAVINPIRFIILFQGFWAFLHASPLATGATLDTLAKIIHSLIIICVARIILSLLGAKSYLLNKLFEKLQLDSASSISTIITACLHCFIYLFSVVLIMARWGYDLSGFLSSLSLGGLAISIAAKDALSNLISGFMLLTNKPFVEGDYIGCGSTVGTVEKVTFRCTAIRADDKTLIYVPNSSILTQSVINYSQRTNRHMDTIIGVEYSTSKEMLLTFIEKVRTMLQSLEIVDEKSIIVAFHGFGDSALNLRVICDLPPTGLKDYEANLQIVNTHIMEIASSLGVSMAFPSTSVYFASPLTYQQGD